MDKTINVLVTGYGPFPRGNGGQYARNASHLVTQLLPSSCTLDEPSVRINILNPTSAEGEWVKVEYAYVRQYTKQLHEKYDREVDLFLHLGQADGWHFVSVERRAYKQGMTSDWWSSREETRGYYMIPDNAGKTIKDAGACPWGEDVPMGLSTALPVDAIVEGARAILKQGGTGRDISAANLDKPITAIEEDPGKMLPVPNEAPPDALEDNKRDVMPVQGHHEAGPYCCGFIYYESLANRYVNNAKAEVLFCHVPGETDAASVEKAKDAVLAIVQSAVREMLRKGGGKSVGVQDKGAVAPMA